MSAGYDGKTIVWDVSFQFPYHTCKFFFLCSMVSNALLTFNFRYGKACLSGYLKRHSSDW